MRTSSFSASPSSSSWASHSRRCRAILAIPPAPRLVLDASLIGVGGGALLRAIGQPLAPWAAGRFVSLLSGALELAGVFAFAAWILPVLVSRGTSRDPFSLHVLLGTVWAVLAAALSAAQALFLAGHAESVIPGDLVEPFYAVALYGLFLSFAFAFSSRMVPCIPRAARPDGAQRAAPRRVAGGGRRPSRGGVVPLPFCRLRPAASRCSALCSSRAPFSCSSRPRASSPRSPGVRARSP